MVRHYHGHLSAVQDLALHPVLDLLVTTARDSTARVWDIRTKAQVFCLSGHTDTVSSVVCQDMNPQVITGSHDSTVRLWDLAAGKSVCSLTNHKVSGIFCVFSVLLGEQRSCELVKDPNLNILCFFLAFR